MGTFSTIDEDIRALERRAELERESKREIERRKLARLGIRTEPKPKPRTIGPGIEGCRGFTQL